MTPGALRKMAWELHYLNYQASLRSDHWHNLKQVIKERYGGICEWPRCVAPCEELHHLTYDTLGDERPQDVAYLCRQHHTLIHLIE